MMKSMTAYAKVSHAVGGLTAEVEIRTYNGRGLDPSIRLPLSLNALEDRIKNVLARKLVRGRVELRLNFSDLREEAIAWEADFSKAEACLAALKVLQENLGIEGKIDLPLLLQTCGNGLLKPAERDQDMEEIWLVVEAALDAALHDIDAMRTREGRYLEEDFRKRLLWMEEEIDAIERASQDLSDVYTKRLLERVGILMKDAGLEPDPGRLLQEVAILVDRSDISEEIVRAGTHIQHFRKIMEDPEPGGRKLNFLLQELNREFNTMGSKAGDTDIAHRVVAVKAELEKLREQIQNIE